MKTQQALNFSGRRRLPLELQSEIAECGLACLSMVAGFHGHQVDITTLRQRFPITLRGATLRQLMSIADSLHLAGRALRIEPELLSKIKLPAILHWDLNHFVVLESTSSGKITIHDPARGVVTLELSEASKHFTGVVLELTPTASFKVKNDTVKVGLMDLWADSRGLWGSLSQILLLSFALQIFVLLSPYYMQLVVDEVVVSRDESFLVVLALGFCTLTLMRTLTRTLRSWVVLYLGTQINFQLVSNLFQHLIRLPLDFFARRHVGDIISRFESLSEIRRMLTTGFVEILVDGIMVIAVFVMMYIYSTTLLAIALLSIATYTAIRFALYRPLKARNEELIIQSAKQDSVFLETIRAIQTIKAFAKETDRQSIWQNCFTEELNAGVGLEKLKISYIGLHELVTGIEYVALVWLGAHQILSGDFTIGMLYAFLAWRQQFADQAQGLVDTYFEYRFLSIHIQRVSDIALTDREAHVHSERGDLSDLKGEIELRNVSFRYSPDEPDILSNISLTVPCGETVVLTGPSGCGKTTLLKIMMGLLKPTEGDVFIDGIELWKLGYGNFRSYSASVLQDDTLLSGSIFDNICFFDSTADSARVKACAEMASMTQDISRMPMGFQTYVGDLGTTLSGGQQQRLLLARALYADPKVLFLDEASSHLDTTTERAINDVIRRLGITRVMSAHRAETIALADRVIQLGVRTVEETPG